MTTRIELVMLQKTMVVVEGVARKLDPQLNMWSTAEPVVGTWIAENLGPLGRFEDLSHRLSALAAFLADAPRRLEQIVNRLEAAGDSDPRRDRLNPWLQSHGANTTIVLIVISLTVVTILWRQWWH
jgi:ubiquinone biosynthesis protein